MITYQDFVAAGAGPKAVMDVVEKHKASPMCRIARSADEYDHQRNETILNYVKMILSVIGTPLLDFTASNNKITSNYFRRLNTQRNTYLLGNGVTFSDDDRL